MSSARAIKETALALGFDLAGVAPLTSREDMEFCRQWWEKGYGGEMRYLANPQRQDPRRVLPSVKSVVCVALNYNTPYPYSTEVSANFTAGKAGGGISAMTPPPRGWVSRYAWGRDYHGVMRSKLEQLRTAIEKLSPDVETRVYVDTGPVVERAFARFSGIGWMGKNTCLINEQKGSWFFLGVILTSLELQLDVPAPDRCGSCTRCLEACPTGALVEPYVMDASRCISYLNIELKGVIPERFRTAIGGNVFGCDICQDVCPWNGRTVAIGSSPVHSDPMRHPHPGEESSLRRPVTTPVPEFQPMEVEVPHGAFAGPADEGKPIAPGSSAQPLSLFHPSLELLASIREEDFRRIFEHSPIKRAKYRGWLRNLCVAMGNSGDPRFVAWLRVAASHPDPVVKEHAMWALKTLQSDM